MATSTDDRVTDVTWTRGNGDETVVEEFSVSQSAADELPVDADPVFDLSERRVLRLERERMGDCACEVIEDLGHPIDSVQVVDDTLLVMVNLADLEDLKDIVANLKAVADRVEVQYLVHDGADDDENRPVVIDRDRLTDRQREVLRTAFQMGYFEYPRDANATAVAEELNIDLSTFTEHLTTAQSKLLDSVLTV